MIGGENMIPNTNKKTKHLFFNLFLIFSVYILVSCGGIICGDLFDRSPEQLISENEYIVIGEFQSVDTIADLGSISYLGSKSKFLILEYAFTINTHLKNAKNINNLFFWNCEREDLTSGYKTFIKFSKNELQLIYGNEIQSSKDLINIMTPLTDVDELKKMMNNINTSYNWNTQRSDSIIAKRILESNSIKNIFLSRMKKGKVLHGTDMYLSTLIDYKSGKLCFYDGSGNGKRLNSKEYLSQLQKKLQN